jgi:hypothetical protein
MAGLSIPTVTRDFPREASLVDRLRKPDSRLLINFISGAPLLRRHAGQGTVLSGHDCMSHFHHQERTHATRLKSWLVTSMRE